MGWSPPVLELVDGGVTARGGADVLALSSPVPLEADDFTARARCDGAVARGTVVRA